MSSQKPETKKFHGGERTVPHKSEKASKYYPADDTKKPKTVRAHQVTVDPIETN